MPAILVAMAMCGLLQQEARTLSPGETAKGTIDTGDPRIEAPELLRQHDYTYRRGETWEITIEEPGVYAFEAHSHFFDAHLVLRGPADEVREANEGDSGSKPSITYQFSETPARVNLQVVALRSFGPYEISVRQLPLTRDMGKDPISERAEKARAGLALVESRSEGPSPALVHALWNIAGPERLQGNRDAARSAARRLEAAARRVYQEDPALLAWGLQTAAQMYFDPTDLDSANANTALTLIEEADDLFARELGQMHYASILCRSDRGAILSYFQRWGEIERLLSPIVEALESDDLAQMDAIPLLNNIAHAYISQGRLDEAVPPLTQAAEALIRSGAPQTNPYVFANLSALHYQSANYGLAREWAEKAVHFAEMEWGIDSPQLCGALSWYALALAKLEDTELAQVVSRRLADLASAGTQEAITAQSVLGDTALLASRYEDALEHYEAAIAWLPDRAEDQKRSFLSRKANALSRIGRTEESIELIEDLLRTASSSVGERHSETLTLLSIRAEILSESGDQNASLEATRELIGVLLEEYPNSPSILEVQYSHLARALLAQDRPEELWASAASSFQYGLDHIERMLPLTSRLERARLKPLLRLNLTLMIEAGLRFPDDRHGDELYLAILAWKGLVFRSNSRWSSASADSREELRPLVDAIRLIDAKLSRRASGRLPANVKLAPLLAERSRLDRQLSQSTQVTAADPAPTLEEIRSSLPPGAIAIDFLVDEGITPRPGMLQDAPENRRVLAWIVQPNTVHPTRLELGPAGPIEIAIEKLIDSLVSSRMRAAGDVPPAITPAKLPTKELTAVRELLWDPIEPHLSNATLLIVSPDQFLGRVPFAGLVDREGKHLIERFAFVEIQSLAELPALASLSTPTDGSLLALGGLDYGKPTVAALAAPRDEPSDPRSEPLFGALEHTGPEALAVRDLFEEVSARKSSVLLSGGRALEKRVKAELLECSIAHFATHARFRVDAIEVTGEPQEAADLLAERFPGLRVALALSYANAFDPEASEDGLLTATEIEGLDLSRMRLAVLSACETAVGVPWAGEGLVSLRRAFLQAGARSVISTVWSIPDESTRELMIDFYEGLWKKGLSPLDALRAAQLERARAGVHPVHWAGFGLSGDWR